MSQDRQRFLQANVATVLKLSQAYPKESDDASEVAAVMAFLRQNDRNSGVNSVRKQERRSSEAESFTVSSNIALDGTGAYNAFFLAGTFDSGVRVAAEMAFFGEGSVEKDPECMEGGTVTYASVSEIL